MVQNLSRHRIVESVRELIKRMATMLNHAGKVGNGLKSASDAYESLAGSINRTVLPQVRRLLEQGIEAPAKGLPKPMPRFQVVKTEIAEVIDTDADLIEALELPPPAAD